MTAFGCEVNNTLNFSVLWRVTDWVTSCVQLCLQLHEDTLKEFDYLDADHPTKKLLATYLEYAKRHYDVVKRWGRFPHRNAILGRENTPEEAEGFSKGEIPAF